VGPNKLWGGRGLWVTVPGAGRGKRASFRLFHVDGKKKKCRDVKRTRFEKRRRGRQDGKMVGHSNHRRRPKKKVKRENSHCYRKGGEEVPGFLSLSATLSATAGGDLHSEKGEGKAMKIVFFQRERRRPPAGGSFCAPEGWRQEIKRELRKRKTW